MPNGHDRNWVRLQASIAGFFVRYSTWPSRVRLFPGAADDLNENVFTEAAFRRIIEKVTLMADPDAAFVAEDDAGHSFNYGAEGMIPGWYQIDVCDWLGISADRAERTVWREPHM